MTRRPVTVVALALGLAVLAAVALALRAHRPALASGSGAIARASAVAWTAPKHVANTGTPDGTDVLTAHNGPARLGWNAHERTLTTANVNPRSFGKLFEIPLDGQAYAQPLIVSDVDLPGFGRRDVLVTATENDSVYAFDADTGEKLWFHTFTGCCGVRTAVPSAVSSVDAGKEGCGSIRPTIGVSSTPVIDRRTNTIYVVAKTMTEGASGPTFQTSLHALDLLTGKDRLPPVTVTGTTQLSTRGMFSSPRLIKHDLKRLLGGTIGFDARSQYSRTALLLANGNLYFGFASHCDIPTAHGWVFAYRASDLAQVGTFVTTRDWNADNGGGVWMAGMGMVADPASGDVYFLTGNGPFNADEGGRNYGDSLIRTTSDLRRVVDYFTPYTQAQLVENDGDFGGGALIALPDRPGRYPHLAVVSSKIRSIFLLDRENLGRYAPRGPDRVLQVVGDEHDQTSWCIGTCGSPAYYAAATGEYVFNVWALDALRAYRLDRSGPRPRLVEVAHSPNAFPGSGGAIPSVSSDGARPGTAIVWATTRPTISDAKTRPIELYAYDANDVSRLLYHGAISIWPNTVGHPFLTPTIANGKVYVGGNASICAFGLTTRPRTKKEVRTWDAGP